MFGDEECPTSSKQMLSIIRGSGIRFVTFSEPLSRPSNPKECNFHDKATGESVKKVKGLE